METTGSEDEVRAELPTADYTTSRLRCLEGDWWWNKYQIPNSSAYDTNQAAVSSLPISRFLMPVKPAMSGFRVLMNAGVGDAQEAATPVEAVAASIHTGAASGALPVVQASGAGKFAWAVEVIHDLTAEEKICSEHGRDLKRGANRSLDLPGFSGQFLV